MTTDPELRVRQYIAALKVPAAPPVAHLLKPRRRVAARLVPVAAALAVLAVIALTLIRPIGAPVAGGDRQPGLPDRFASYSTLTGPVSKYPPGTAIALYQHGLNLGPYDHPQAVVLGAYDDVYRRVEVAENPDGALMAMLSPDGTRVAVGNLNGSNALHLVDLTTGRSEKLPTSAVPSLVLSPAAWSPDGRYLIVVRDTGTRLLDALLYDLTTRDMPTALQEKFTRSAAAFAPDGTRLAFQADDGLRVVDLTTNVTVALPQPGDMRGALLLAWSPDGQLLAATGTDERVHFVDATGSGQPVPAAVACDLAFVLAWTGPRTVLLSRDGFIEVNVDSRERRRVSGFDNSRIWPAEFHELGSMSFATNLMIGIQSRPADAWPDRGPWPTWLRLTTIVCVMVLAAAAALLVRWIRRRLRRA